MLLTVWIRDWILKNKKNHKLIGFEEYKDNGEVYEPIIKTIYDDGSFEYDHLSFTLSGNYEFQEKIFAENLKDKFNLNTFYSKIKECFKEKFEDEFEDDDESEAKIKDFKERSGYHLLDFNDIHNVNV